MEINLDYGELATNTEFVGVCEELKKNLLESQAMIQQLLPLKAQYDKMPLPSQIDLDLFFAYALNAYHWVHLRLKGLDPNDYPIKGELERLKTAMQKWEEIRDADNRPTVNIEAAKRFIRSGLYDPYKAVGRANKITKFDNDE